MAAPKKKITTEPNVRFPNFQIVIEPDVESPLIVITDWNIASYLKTIHYEIYTVRKKSNGYSEFYFKVRDADDPQEAARDIIDFMNNRGRGGMYLAFANNYKDIKSLASHL